MNTTSHPRRTAGQALGRLLSVALAVWLLGSVYTPALATTSVAQQPLTLQPAIPPNITLMLDDSGSMAWDFMPDANSLTGHFTATDENGYADSIYVPADALRSSGINGTYYNPDTIYSAPVHADGTSYPTPTTLDAAYLNPFNSTSSTVDVTQYASPQLCGYTGYDNTNSSSDSSPCPNSLYYAFPYYTAFPTSGNTNVSKPTVSCSNGDSVDSTTGMCGTSGSWYVPTYSCNSSSNSNQYDAATGYCDPGSNGNYIYLFTYTTWDSTASAYVRHYVGKSSSDCAAAPSSTCVYDATTQKNVATWFSYYRTRILMAKSGLMTAFATIDPAFRVGFGSIDGGDGTNYNGTGSAGNKNYLNLPALRYTYADAYNGGNNYIAEVAPFDTNCATSPTTCTPGQTGTQRANFWNWVSKATVAGGTPLRQALDAVGGYYSDSTGQAWSTMSTDPVSSTDTTELACRQSYSILTTDGFWNGSYSSTTTAGASDASGPTVLGPNNQTSTYTPAAPFSGGDTSDGSPSLADVAMYYWKTDLRSDTANEVPPGTQDSAFWQHMSTFTIGLGFTPTGITGTDTSGVSPPTIQDISDWANNGSKSAITGFGWPTPASNSIYNIADLAHAGVNGHGGFYSATSPATFASGLTDALARASERVGTGASLAANSTQLTNGTVAYQANYYTGKWKGDLKALSIDSSTGAISTTPTWSAATMLPAAASRNIWTYNPSAAAGAQFLQFKNSGTGTTLAPPVLSSAELAALGSSSTIQAQIVDYLRGDGTLGIYRSRDTALGDIVDSQPVYSGAPDSNEFENQTFSGINAVSPSTDSFETWAVGTTDTNGDPVASAAASRTPLVFVAANDGMLHAFNASTGVETFAYLPGAVITAGVANLANTNYGSTAVPHQYYNDGELTIADVYLPALAQINSSSWHTILVGTTGRGPAEAVYALDVTDPANIKPLWERSAGDGLTNSTYIGQMVGKPVIAQVADGNWQVLIGNGYNSTGGTGGTDTAALLEFNLADGTLSVHTTDTTTGNGLAAPVTWMDDATNGISMRAYAGDLAGRVWMFPLDTETTTTSGHGSGQTSTTTYTADLTTAGTKVFTATDPSGVAQPITGGMVAGSDSTTGNLWLFFGTGRYLSTSDIGASTPQVQSWYGLIARTGTTDTTSKTNSSLVARAIVYEQDIDLTASPPIILGSRAVTPTPSTPDITGTKIGWYMNLEAPTGASGALVAQGERMVTPNQFQGNLLLATTRIPVVTDICNPSGSGWVMAVNPFTGTNPAANFFTGGSGGGSVTYTNSSGKSVTVATAGVGFSALPNSPIFVGGNMLMSFDNGTTSNLLTAGSTAGTSRVSWQELVNP